MNNFKPVYKGQLEMASIRLVKDAPIMSENEIHNAGDAVKLLGEYLCEMDREVLCIINMKTNGIPINCSICSIGVVDQTIAQPREVLKTAILSNAAGMIIMHNHPIMIDAPKEVNIVRSKAIEKRIQDPELLATIPKYYKNPEGAEKKKKSKVVIVQNK